MLDRIVLIVKPTSSCNFRCKYCYHASTNYPAGFLSLDKLERLIRLAQDGSKEVEYIWHGGEPLLCGLSFFEEAVHLQQKYRNPSNRILNSVQTNGSLIDEYFATFFRENDFDISVSIDGPGANNNLRDQTENVLENISLLKQNHVRVATISVIHSLNVDHQIEMYEFFKTNKLPMKFNPIFSDGSATLNSQYLLSAERYIHSFVKFFEYWLTDQQAVRMDPIDQYLSLYFRHRGIDCIYGSCLGHWLGIDHEGNLFPCGRTFPTEYVFINLDSAKNLQEIYRTENYKKIMRNAIIRRNRCELNCEFFGICQGGCNNNAMLEHHDISVSGGFICEVLKEVMNYLEKTLTHIRNDPDAWRNFNPLVQHLLTQTAKSNP